MTNEPSAVARSVRRDAYKRAAEQLRSAAKALRQAGAPTLALRAGHDAQECDVKARQIDQGLIP